MTTPLTLRSVKGSALTHNEVDANFTALRTTADGAVQVLTADINLYVRADGNDANDGLADTAGGAFLTIQRAANECVRYVGREFYDAGIVINIGAGTYTEYVDFAGSRTAQGRTILLTGTSVDINGAVSASGVSIEVSGLTITDGTLSAYDNGFIRAQGCTLVRSYLQAASGAGIFADDCVFTGNTSFAAYAYWAGRIGLGVATFSGTPDYSQALAWCESGGLIQFTDMLTGTATGKRFNVLKNGIIEATAGGISALPGDVAGTTATDGRYFYNAGVLPADGAGTYVDKTGDTMTGPLAIASGTLTASTPALDISQTWNAGGVTFTGFKADVTGTAYSVRSSLFDLKFNGSTYFGFYPFGYFFTIGVLNGNDAPEHGFMRDSGLVLFGNNSAPYGGSTSRTIVCRSQNAIFNQNGVLQFGDNWSTYVSDVGIGRNAAGVLEVNSGALGTLRDLKARNTITPGVTVASLAGAAQGARSFVTDSTVAAAGNFGAIVAGTGANAVPVYYDGANWRIG